MSPLTNLRTTQTADLQDLITERLDAITGVRFSEEVEFSPIQQQCDEVDILFRELMMSFRSRDLSVTNENVGLLARWESIISNSEEVTANVDPETLANYRSHCEVRSQLIGDSRRRTVALEGAKRAIISRMQVYWAERAKPENPTQGE